jgi:hypothetical protein
MVVENIDFTTDSISRSNKSGMRASLSTAQSGKYGGLWLF